MNLRLITTSVASAAAAAIIASQVPALGEERVGHPQLLSPHAQPLAIHHDLGLVFVANTPADTVDVLDASTGDLRHRIKVGIDPVSIAIRPDGEEVWVANHVSDSVNIIDTRPDSPGYLGVVAVVQEFDRETKATRFDEPVGIAFADNTKAYVALSSENEVAVIDVATRTVSKRLKIPAQDPRAIAVRDGRLYVLPFESNNRTQLSGGSADAIDGNLVTFDAWDHSIANNNILSLGHVLDIVKHPEVPDRDLFVYDTDDEELLMTVEDVGTLLYGLAIDSEGRAFVSQTDARNEVNGRAGTEDHGLAELGNRAFLNQITRIEIGGEPAVERIELEPLPPTDPAPGTALATPYGIAVSDDDRVLVATAAGSDLLFTVDVESGEVLGRAKVGAVPRGIALECDSEGSPARAFVLNAVADSVSMVDLRDPSNPKVVKTIGLDDPTPPDFKRGRALFNSAAVSTTGTFSCASCHPDAHTDQLLWVLKTPVVSGGDQIQPRSTMPIRGLRDTAPFHWDGIPGDPYGGNNSASIHKAVEPNSDPDDPLSPVRHLIDGGLANTMLRPGDETENDGGRSGFLSEAQRDELAAFILNVPYPPAPKRAFDNVVTERARRGFELFHILGNHEDLPAPNVCGDCHRMPHLVSTNTPGSGMDAPTWRGAQDRFLILPQGRLNIIDFDFFRRIAERGTPERAMWRLTWKGKERFDPVWEMVLEGSTGFSGSFGRQVTLSAESADEPITGELFRALVTSAEEGGVVLQGEGLLRDKRVSLRHGDGVFEVAPGGRRYSTEELLALAATDDFLGTFTARHGRYELAQPQPALWTRGPIQAQRGRQNFPVLYPGMKAMEVSGDHLLGDATVLVDGRRFAGQVVLGQGTDVVIELDDLPGLGLHLLQVQNPGGLVSNDFIFHVAGDEASAREIMGSGGDRSDQLMAAVRGGDLEAVRRILNTGLDPNFREEDDGSSPLSAAAFHGRTAIARALLGAGADPAFTNRDGNTPLHVAAFLCREEIVEALLENDAPLGHRNERGERPADTVAGEWSDGLADFYRHLDGLGDLNLDLEDIRRRRPEVLKRLGGE